jgi:hypothetical protein
MIGTGVGPSSGPARPRPVCHVGSSTGFAGTRLQPGQRADHLHRELRLARERLSGLKRDLVTERRIFDTILLMRREIAMAALKTKSARKSQERRAVALSSAARDREIGTMLQVREISAPGTDRDGHPGGDAHADNPEAACRSVRLHGQSGCAREGLGEIGHPGSDAAGADPLLGARAGSGPHVGRAPGSPFRGSGHGATGCGCRRHRHAPAGPLAPCHPSWPQAGGPRRVYQKGYPGCWAPSQGSWDGRTDGGDRPAFRCFP